MPKEDGYFTPESRKKVPPRGKSNKNRILDAITKKGLLQLKKGATRDEAEEAVFGFLAESAFNPSEDQSFISSTCMNQLMKKGWPDLKAVDPAVKFDFDPNGTPLEKATQIMQAISDGEVPPGTGVNLLSAMASVMKIEEVTEISRRLDELEKAAGITP